MLDEKAQELLKKVIWAAKKEGACEAALEEWQVRLREATMEFDSYTFGVRPQTNGPEQKRKS